MFIFSLFVVQAVKYCIGACFSGILWDLKTVEEMLESGTAAEHELEKLKMRVHSFMELMKQILETSPVQMYRDEVSEFRTTLFTVNFEGCIFIFHRIADRSKVFNLIT